MIASPDLYLKRFESVERKAERLWFHHYRPAAGDVVVDAGAGIGEDTIVFSRRVTQTGRVIAIEAHSRVFRCLQKTVRRSGLANVTALLCAVYSSEGEIFISTDELHAANTVVDAAPGERVTARSLGSLFEELGLQRVDLLKLNIEGAEADALEGFGAGWGAVRNVVISCHDFLAEHGGSPKFRTRSSVVALLESRKFRILSSHPDAPEDWARDYVYGVARWYLTEGHDGQQQRVPLSRPTSGEQRLTAIRSFFSKTAAFMSSPEAKVTSRSTRPPGRRPLPCARSDSCPP